MNVSSLRVPAQHALSKLFLAIILLVNLTFPSPVSSVMAVIRLCDRLPARLGQCYHAGHHGSH